MSRSDSRSSRHSNASRQLNSEGIHWSFTKIIITLALLGGGIACIVLGVMPFVTASQATKDYANIGFILLISIFIFGFFKVRKTSRFIFWSLAFALVLYANLMFIFYETLFFD